MLSLEKAKALREAGLVWEPQIGDWYICMECNGEKRTGYGVVTQLPHGQYQNHIELFAPRLDQLLAEIEKRGWSWDIQIIKPLPLDPPQVYRCEVWRIGAGNYKQCDANTTEDAIADALIMFRLALCPAPSPLSPLWRPVRLPYALLFLAAAAFLRSRRKRKQAKKTFLVSQQKQET